MGNGMMRQRSDPLEKGNSEAQVSFDSGDNEVNTETTVQRAMIPLVLLALAKDGRYLEQGDNLLEEMTKGWGVPLSASLRKVLSTCLYYAPLILVSSRRFRRGGTVQRTHGMDACDVDFRDKVDGPKFALASISLVVLHFVLEHYETSIRADGVESNEFDKLKGSSRRALFERQRESMLDRASIKNQYCVATTEAVRTQRWRQSMLQVLFKASSATPPGFGGPHMRTQDESWEINVHSTFLWLLRLHSAIYLLNGKYPTVLHRLLRLKLQSRSSSNNRSGPVGSYDLEYAIGVLLAGFSVGALFQVASQAFLDHLRTRNNNDMSAKSSTLHISRDNDDNKKSCMICGGERKHPSCSIQCGHVFCWACLHTWVQNRSKACPFCRTPCSAKDIVYLQNYVCND